MILVTAEPQVNGDAGTGGESSVASTPQSQSAGSVVSAPIAASHVAPWVDDEPVVKSPPEPTRVKSPEQMIMRSPEPVNWTVPLDTGKTFTVTQNVREGKKQRKKYEKSMSGESDTQSWAFQWQENLSLDLIARPRHGEDPRSHRHRNQPHPNSRLSTNPNNTPRILVTSHRRARASPSEVSAVSTVTKILIPRGTALYRLTYIAHRRRLRVTRYEFFSSPITSRISHRNLEKQSLRFFRPDNNFSFFPLIRIFSKVDFKEREFLLS